MAGGQHKTSVGAILSDQAGGGGGRQQAPASYQQSPDPIGRSHLDDDLCRLPVVVSAIATQHQGDALRVADGVQNGLNEVLKVMWLQDDLDFLAQARSSGLLVFERLGADGFDVHGRLTVKQKSACIVLNSRRGHAMTVSGVRNISG